MSDSELIRFKLVCASVGSALVTTVMGEPYLAIGLALLSSGLSAWIEEKQSKP